MLEGEHERFAAYTKEKTMNARDTLRDRLRLQAADVEAVSEML